MKVSDWIRSRKPKNVYYGWWVFAASAGMVFFVMGIFFRGFNIFFVPIRDSLGLKEWQTSLVFAIARAEGGLEGPAAGWLVERVGVRRIVTIGIVLAAVGYFALFWVNSFITFALVYLGLVALFNTLAFEHGVFSGLNMWFIRRRGMVLSLYGAVGALGGVALVPALNFFIIEVDWTWAAVIIGIGYLVLLLPLAQVLRQSPESIGLRPDGDPAPPGASFEKTSVKGKRASIPPDPRDFEVGEALRTPAFWFLVGGMGMRNWARTGAIVNLQPILLWRGVSRTGIGPLVSLSLVASVVGRLAVGATVDRWNKSRIAAGLLLLDSIGLLFLLTGSWDGASWAILTYLVLSGSGEAAAPVTWALLGDLFGRKRYASLRGVIKICNAWTLITAPIFVGWWADRTGGYTLPLWVAAAVLGVGAVSFMMIKKPSRRLTEGDAQASLGQPH